MRRLIPDDGDELLDELYTDLDIPAGGSRPHVYLDMIATADGAASVGGRTRSMSGEADRLAFARLRETCDAILVGANTVIVENYGPPTLSDAATARRVTRGLAPVPTIVVVSAELRFDPAARLFSDPDRRPTILTVEDAPALRREALAEVADVVTVGTHTVDLPAAMTHLRTMGIARLLCEGGPTLNAQLIAADLVDELFLTIAPVIAGASPLRIVDGEIGSTRGLTIVEAREHEGELLLRYAFRRASDGHP